MEPVTRGEYLSSLVPLSRTPTGVEGECAICQEKLVDPVQICAKHVFCQDCITKWLTQGKKNSCPTCRRPLFDPMSDRRAYGADRLRVLAQALERSGLLSNSFDMYGYSGYTSPELDRAIGAANGYLIEHQHSQVAVTSWVTIDIRVLGPHVIAMGNVIRELARSNNRGYSVYQKRDWKIMLDRMLQHISHTDRCNLLGDFLAYRAFDLRVGILNSLHSLRDEGIDCHSSRFFVEDAGFDSPSGDLDFLLDYVVFRAMQDYQRRFEETLTHTKAQQEALRQETNPVLWCLRRTRQWAFNVM